MIGSIDIIPPNNMDSLADVSAIFWPLIEAIIVMKYDEIQQTRFFEIMHRCMVKEQAFILDICGHQLIHKDLNELFYGTRDFLVSIGENEKAHIIHQAILKMQGVVVEMELSEMIDSLNISSSMDDLLNHMDNLIIA